MLRQNLEKWLNARLGKLHLSPALIKPTQGDQELAKGKEDLDLPEVVCFKCPADSVQALEAALKSILGNDVVLHRREVRDANSSEIVIIVREDDIKAKFLDDLKKVSASILSSQDLKAFLAKMGKDANFKFQEAGDNVFLSLPYISLESNKQLQEKFAEVGIKIWYGRLQWPGRDKNYSRMGVNDLSNVGLFIDSAEKCKFVDPSEFERALEKGEYQSQFSSSSPTTFASKDQKELESHPSKEKKDGLAP